MNAKQIWSAVCAVVVVGASTVTTDAQPFNPTGADLDALTDVTTVFGATQLSTIDALDTAGPGTNFDVTWRAGTGGLGGENFSRVVLQRANFNADLSAFDTLDLVFTPDHAGVGVKPFVQTGAGFTFFETPFISLPANVPTLVSFDLSGLPDINNVRQFGFQLFGPNPAVGQTITGSIRVTAIPEPASIALVGLAALMALAARRTRR